MTPVVGQVFHYRLRIDEALVEQFAAMSGDRNPIHVDRAAARSYGFDRPVAHGAILLSAVSRMIGLDIPGHGAVWMSQSVEWLSPTFVGDEIELSVTVSQVSAGTGMLGLDVVAKRADGAVVMTGHGKVKMGQKLDGHTPTPDGRRAALVTGASGAIGGAIALRLAASGIAVAVHANQSAARAEALLGEIRAAGGSGCVVLGDLASGEEGAAQVAGAALVELGRLDIVVHAATPPLNTVSVDELSMAAFEPYLRSYLGGALGLLKVVRPGMAQRRSGRLIFIGTAAASAPPPGWAPYVAAKEALWGLVKCLARELGPDGITTNMVSPGLTISELTANVASRAKEVEARRNPLRRLATADDTAAAVSFLASLEGGYVNGVNLPVTGGL